jgi:hypothetical protein
VPKYSGMSTIQMPSEGFFVHPHPTLGANVAPKKTRKTTKVNWGLFFTYVRNIILLFPTFLGLVLSIIFKQAVLLGVGLFASLALLPNDLEADDDEDK